MSSSLPFGRLRRAAAALAVAAPLTMPFAGPLAVPLAAQPSPRVPLAPLPGVGPLRAPAAPYAIAYRVAMPDPASHRFHVTLDVAAPRGALPDTLLVDFPTWSPGRYARMDFARNVQRFAAEAGGAPRRWVKLDGSTWGVLTGGAPSVRVRYEVFANQLSGTFSVLDTAHANWNGPSLFAYVRGHKPDPVTLAVDAPAGWRVVNGAQGNPGYAGAAPNTFRFPNYDELADTPTEVAPAAALTVDSFAVDGVRYRVMVRHVGPRPGGATARFVDAVRRIVARQNRVVAPPPVASYTFLVNVGDRGGDGMEHLYSTQVMNRDAWTDTARLLPGLSTASHEYFHTWNVKRVRPAALGPFDYTRAVHQPSLWVAEGWTNYYGNVTLHRAGAIDRPEFYRRLGNTLRTTSESPARKERSARQASFDAPFFDGAAQPTAVNSGDTFLSYYPKGEVLALALDLTLRDATAGRRSLDDVLRALKRRVWDEAPRESYYLPGRGYTEDDVERAASDVAGRDLRPWFDRYVGGTDDLPWPELLKTVGLTVTPEGEGDARRWVVAEDPAAAPARRAARDAWLR